MAWFSLLVQQVISKLIVPNMGESGLFTHQLTGQQWLKNIGGQDYLKRQLTDEFEFFSYKDGLVIKAGSHPQFGDIERNNIPNQYRIISQLLKPIRAEYPVALQRTHPKKPTLDRGRTKEWFARFD